MARPTVKIPEATRLDVLRLRREGATLKEISRKTGLKYHLVRRILAEAEAPPRLEALADADNMQRPSAVAQPIFVGTKSSDEFPKEDTGFGKKRRKSTGRGDERHLKFRERERHRRYSHYMTQEAGAQREYEYLSSPEYQRNQRLRSDIEYLHLLTEEIKANQDFLRLFLPKQPPNMYEFCYDRYGSLLVEEVTKCMARGLNPQQIEEYLLFIRPSLLLDAMKPAS
jgi:hypothetical protein